MILGLKMKLFGLLKYVHGSILLIIQMDNTQMSMHQLKFGPCCSMIAYSIETRPSVISNHLELIRIF